MSTLNYSDKCRNILFEARKRAERRNATIIESADLIGAAREQDEAYKLLLTACQAVADHLVKTYPPYTEGDSPFDKVRAALAAAERTPLP